MKNLSKVVALLLIQMFVQVAVAQETCNLYFASAKGTKLELSSLDKKDKIVAVSKIEIADAKSISGGMEYVIKSELYDGKNKFITNAEQTATCVNGDYVMNVQVMNAEMMPKDANMKVLIDGDKLFYPANMKAGDVLKDANVTIKTTMGSMTIMNSTVNIIDRKVVGAETIETPAGKFDCLKITYTTKMKFMGSRTMNSVEYLSKGVGIVKSEQFDEKGNKQSSVMLTKISR